MPTLFSPIFNAPRRGASLQVTSSTAERSPFPSRVRTIAPLKLVLDFQCRAVGAIADLINLAVIALPKAAAVGRDHLIHRNRSPFPYEGKALMPGKVGVSYTAGRGRAKRCHERRTAGGCSTLRARLRWMR